MKSGESVRFYHFASPDRYALKKGTDIKSEAVFEDESLPRSDIAISQVGNVPLAEKAKSIRRVYRITGISANRIALLERQPDQRFEATGNLMDGAPAIAPTQAEETKKKFMLAGGVGLVAVGAAFFLWVRRKRRSENVLVTSTQPLRIVAPKSRRYRPSPGRRAVCDAQVGCKL